MQGAATSGHPGCRHPGHAGCRHAGCRHPGPGRQRWPRAGRRDLAGTPRGKLRSRDPGPREESRRHGPHTPVTMTIFHPTNFIKRGRKTPELHNWSHRCLLFASSAVCVGRRSSHQGHGQGRPHPAPPPRTPALRPPEETSASDPVQNPDEAEDMRSGLH